MGDSFERVDVLHAVGMLLIGDGGFLVVEWRARERGLR
jgi:hypothetical protein